MILTGDTVRLKVHFKTFTGQAVNPVNISLRIYDDAKNLIEEIPIDDTHKLDVGIFYYDYVPASELNEFIFEFAGSYNNKPILSRGKVTISFYK